ncbi:hypothetical protein BDV95DRAFT_578558 [Massariosphaeria phaeospora]|uniref:Uncharacterized protein n=1 Tax=Massariosphaeria phaeospora TaxID=100035 RepID=A0A7C8M8Y1_9PLEO|nr:hypothetical protein BDV95DRAFT_578558 [Massariosphaeria phaeospora]
MADVNLGLWIHEHHIFLENFTKDSSTQPFVYEDKAWPGPNVGLDDITVWILASGSDSPARAYAEEWDNAMLAYVRSWEDLGDESWTMFVHALRQLHPATLELKHGMATRQSWLSGLI